jgi:signal peptidase II
VKKNALSVYWLLIPTCLIVIIDEWLKNFGLRTFQNESAIQNPAMFNLAIHKNWGLAFDLPFRVWVIVLISIILGYFLLEIAYKNLKTQPYVSFSCLLIMIGALGNLFDRIVYGFTVDYLIFFGRSALNLSDIIIVIGVVALLLASRKSKRQSSTTEI